MTTAEIVALVIGGWSLVSFLFALAAGRIIQIFRCHCPLESAIFAEPLRDSSEDEQAIAEPREHSETPSSLCA